MISSKNSPWRRPVRRLTWRFRRSVDGEPGVAQNLVVEAALVVDHDDRQRIGAPAAAGRGEGRDHVLDVGRDGGFRRALLAGPDLVDARILQPEQLERVPVLLVVVDPARVRR